MKKIRVRIEVTFVHEFEAEDDEAAEELAYDYVGHELPLSGDYSVTAEAEDPE